MGHTMTTAAAVCKATEGKEQLMPYLLEGLRRRRDGNISMSEGQSPPVYVSETQEPNTCVFSGVSSKIPRSLGMLHFTIHSPEQD